MESPPTRAPNARGVCKNRVFRPIEKFPAQNSYLRESVSIRHGGLRRRRCAGRGIRGIINSVGRSQSLLITLTAQLSVTWHIMWDGAPHARFAMAIHIAVIRVQDYAGSRCSWKCCSGWYAICWRNSYNNSWQHFNWQSVARVSRR